MVPNKDPEREYLTSRIEIANNRFSIIPGSDGGATGVPKVPTTAMPALDLFALLLAHKLRYGPHERDMVFLSHELIARPRSASPDTDTREEIHTSSLIVRGTPEHSAMALTVGLPVAYAALRILDGGVHVRGVAGPTADVGLYRGILGDLETVGLGMRESVVKRKERAGTAAKMMST
jgi:alpha-aminoadipic semialdehyde synthase